MTIMLLLFSSILFSNCHCKEVVREICVAPSTKGKPSFKEGTEYDIQYVGGDIIEEYDEMNNNAESEWPYRHGVWGFKAASISMTDSNGNQYTENILIPAIPIYIPEGNKVTSNAIPRGQYFYVFSTDSVMEYPDPEFHRAIVIEFWQNNKQFTHLTITTIPTTGAKDSKQGRFCDTDQTEGMCFGQESCCDAFQTLLTNGIPSESKCRTILLCPKGVIKIGIEDLLRDGVLFEDNGLQNLEIRGVQYEAKEQENGKDLKPLFVAESDYMCPDGSYHIHLNCPKFAQSMKKGNVEETSFMKCPFCTSIWNRYQIFPPGNGEEVRGDCPDKEKYPSFGFINKKGDYLSCCIKRHNLASNHVKGAYSKYPIGEYIKRLTSEQQTEGIEEGGRGEMQSVTNGVSENKYATKEREELRDAEKVAAQKETTPPFLNENGIITFSVTRSLIIGMLIAILMIISSSYIYFR